mmetsp:Transcript_15856/g.51957  ORF Transcript_15856/g.51957 Transcript_15856/m.51957 type:complete len:423 (-) Transcript_15856:840-2108(-)
MWTKCLVAFFIFNAFISNRDLVLPSSEGSEPALPLIRLAFRRASAARPERSIDLRIVLLIERERKQCAMICQVRSVPRSDDHGGHLLLLEDPARGDVGDGGVVFGCDARERLEEVLQPLPRPDSAQHRSVLLLRKGVHPHSVRSHPKRRLREEAAAEHAVREQADAALLAEARHLALWTPIEQRILNLVRRHLHPRVANLRHARRVKVGEGDVLHLAARFEVHQIQTRVDVPFRGVVVPIHLHEIQVLRIGAEDGSVDRVAHKVERHRPLLLPDATQLRENLHLVARHLRFGSHLHVIADDSLRWAVAASHRTSVERGDACFDELGKVVHSVELRGSICSRVATVTAGQLPASFDDGGAVEVRGCGERGSRWHERQRCRVRERRAGPCELERGDRRGAHAEPDPGELASRERRGSGRGRRSI